MSRRSPAFAKALTALAALATTVAAAATAQPGSSGQIALERVASALQAAPCWRAGFEQRYVPAGFETGATDRGRLTVAHPSSLRFDYEGEQPRVFATDGAVARYADPDAMTCSATRLDATTWGRLPLAAILDPGAARATFAISGSKDDLTLTPHEPTPELARVEVTVGVDALPARVTIVDGSGNRNEFTFTRWTRSDAPERAYFQPAIPGMQPCEPAEE